MRRNDTLLLNTRPNKKLKPSNVDWIEPPSMMDFQLGDSLLSQARIKFSGGTYVPPLVSSPARSLTPARTYSPVETLFGADDLLLKMEIIFPQLTGTRGAVGDRLDYLRSECNLRIHMKEMLIAKPSCLSPNIVFGPSSNGFHPPLFREGTVNMHNYKDLEALAKGPAGIVGFKERNEPGLPRFEFSNRAFVHFLEAFEARIREISELTSVWTPRNIAPFILAGLVFRVTGTSYLSIFWLEIWIPKHFETLSP